MDEQAYDLFLTGQIAPGHSREQALQQLAKLFKRQTNQAEQLLAGRPTRIRKNLTAAELEKFQAAFARLGILTEAMPCLDDSGSVQTPPVTSATSPGTATNPGSTSGLALDPVGTPVLHEAERRPFTECDIDTSTLSLAATGTTLSSPRLRQVTTPETDHLSLAAAGSDMQDHYRETREEDLDALTAGLSMASTGEAMLEEQYKKPQTAIQPNTDKLKLT